MEKAAGICGIDHIGYAVADMDAAKKIFSALGYKMYEDMTDNFRGANVCMAGLGGVKVKLLAPLPKGKSPVDGYLKKVGSTPYHICYEVDHMEECIKKLQKSGFMLLGEPAASVPLGGDVCFLYSVEIGLIELIDYKGCRG